MQIVHILAARPNFIKAAPVINELANKGHNNCIIHTNQHYDFLMSKVFFEDLNIPEPDYHLGIRSGTHGVQTGTSIIEIINFIRVALNLLCFPILCIMFFINMSKYKENNINPYVAFLVPFLCLLSQFFHLN